MVMMKEKVKDYLQRHHLLNQQKGCLVALSGGADSVALLLVLRELGYSLHAVHCNFHLRGEESDRDEQFCESLCRHLNVPFHRIHFDTRIYAEVHQVSIELAARELRYDYFEQLRRDLQAQAVCVAHHRDDAAETIMMNIVRGTGVRGLTGIKPRQGNVVRPLLCVSRAEIEQYLVAHHQDYVTDSTNLTDDATRNKVRHQLMPLLIQLNNGAIGHLLEMAVRMESVEQLLAERLKPLMGCSEMDRDQLLKLAPSAYLTYEVLRSWGFNARQCEQIYEGLVAGHTGVVFVAGNNQLLLDREHVVIESVHDAPQAMRIPEEGIYVVGDHEKMRVRSYNRESSFVPSKSPRCVTLDASKVDFPLTIRCVEEGDRMHPYGMKGTKLLSDMLTDRKMTLFEKHRQRVVVDGQGRIAWLVAIRCDHRVAVTDETTKILELSLIPYN